MIRVMVVDDHVLVRKGIAGLLATQQDMEVVGEAGDGFEALCKARTLRPDIVLMDLHMPGCDGIEATRRLVQEVPQTRVVILTYSQSENDLVQALQRGADGYLLKDLEPEVFFSFIRGVSRGEKPISAAMTATLVSKLRGDEAAEPSRDPPVSHEPAEDEPPLRRLTPRQKEILSLVSKGATNKEIATALHITENTVKNHLKNILERLEMQNRVQAVAYALRKGLIPKPVTVKSHPRYERRQPPARA